MEKKKHSLSGIEWPIIYFFSDDSMGRSRSLVIQKTCFRQKKVYLYRSTRLRSHVLGAILS